MESHPDTLSETLLREIDELKEELSLLRAALTPARKNCPEPRFVTSLHRLSIAIHTR